MMPGPNHLKILLVEDDRGYSRLALSVLEGYQRVHATTAEQGLDVFRTEKPDIVFLDIGLPDKNGLIVLSEMKAERPDAFIVMMTTSRVSEDVKNASERGAIGYIVKPFTRGKMLDYLKIYENYKEKMAALSAEAFSKMQQEFFAKAKEVQLAHEPKAKAAHLPASREKNPKSFAVLYVEPNKTTANTMKTKITELGCQIAIAENAEQALALAKEQSFQLAILHHDEPRLNAQEIAARLRTETAWMPLAVLLEDKGHKLPPKWRRLNISHYLRKPVKATEVLTMVETELTRYLAENDEIYIA